MFVLVAWAATLSTAGAECPRDYGDLTGDATVDAADVQCAIVAAHSAMQQPPPPVACLVGSALELELSGDGQITLVDIQALVALSLGAGLPAEADSNTNGCLDTSETVCGDATCEDTLGETCLSCPNDCGGCPNSCCEVHDSPGCAEPSVEACTCAISDFCCTFFWDESCVELTQEFCSPKCPAPNCPVFGVLSCGETQVGSTGKAASTFGSYSCGGSPASGGDRIYSFFSPTESGMEVSISSQGISNPAVRILSGDCDPQSCVAVGDLNNPAKTKTEAGATYFVVVDQSANFEGGFSLTVTCADACDVPALCGDAECGTVSCAGFDFSCGTCAPDKFCDAGVCSEGGGPGPGSCVGQCGGADPSGSCYCDDFCVFAGDCCANACAACGFCAGGGGGGCAGFCGSSPPFSLCYCDASCQTFGDCCPDACAACGFCP